MADKKISELTAATTVAVADLLVLVQGAETKKVSSDTFLSNMPRQAIDVETAQTLSADGAISVSNRYTLLSKGSAGAYTLDAGTHGVEKIIAATTAQTHTITVSSPADAAFDSIVLDAVGESVTLQNIAGLWYVKASVGAVIS